MEQKCLLMSMVKGENYRHGGPTRSPEYAAPIAYILIPRDPNHNAL